MIGRLYRHSPGSRPSGRGEGGFPARCALYPPANAAKEIAKGTHISRYHPNTAAADIELFLNGHVLRGGRRNLGAALSPLSRHVKTVARGRILPRAKLECDILGGRATVFANVNFYTSWKTPAQRFVSLRPCRTSRSTRQLFATFTPARWQNTALCYVMPMRNGQNTTSCYGTPLHAGKILPRATRQWPSWRSRRHACWQNATPCYKRPRGRSVTRKSPSPPRARS